ncbi:unnamed protein product, partial [Choristocarpus tenellus]
MCSSPGHEGGDLVRGGWCHESPLRNRSARQSIEVCTSLTTTQYVTHQVELTDSKGRLWWV